MVWKVVAVDKPLLRPQNKHKRLLRKQAQNVTRRHPQKSWCPIDPHTELKNIQNYVYCGFQWCWGYFHDKQYSYKILIPFDCTKAFFIVWEKAMWKMVYKHLSDRCKLLQWLVMSLQYISAWPNTNIQTIFRAAHGQQMRVVIKT